MIASTPDYDSPWPPPLLNWDWWPLARLLTVCFVLGAAGYHYLGWHVDLSNIVTLPHRVFEVLSFCALLSFGLAHLYLILLMFPIYAIVTLNDTFYGVSLWTGRTILRLRSSRCLAIAGLCGEIALFGFCLLALGRLAARL